MTNPKSISFVGGRGTDSIFSLDYGDVVHHTFIFGSTGHGRSSILEAEANRLGISYEELLKRMEPTPEQIEEEERRQEQAQQEKDLQRLNAVREAFWVGTAEEDSKFDNLHDALTCAEIVDEPTRQQQKALFMMLPAEIIGQGIAWGFTDTEVRDSIHTFVSENRAAVFEQVIAIKD